MTSTATSITRCIRCGALLSAAVAEGLCPGCLTRSIFSDDLDASLPEAELPEGLTRIGGYELVERIARGGMGIVYRARQLSLNREVAVKVLLDSVFASADELARFREEAAVAAALHHPNIVAIHEVGEDAGRRFFSMSFIAGKDLAELTREGPLPATEAAGLMVKIADAIHHTHERGILHRDLKPSNVLVDKFGQPHVTDFGLAKRISGVRPASASVADGSDDATPPLTLTGQVIGTPGYMSPEQATAKREVGPSTDIYSLGALLYHLITARAPFVAETPTAVLRQVEEREPVAPKLLNPSIPRDLETICLKCLNKEPTRRYASAAEMAADLGRFLRNEPILARPAGGGERLVRWCRRNPVIASLTMAVGLLLTIVAIGSALSARRIEKDRMDEAALRVEAEDRLREGERLINFMLGDLADRLEPVGRLEVLETTIKEVDGFYSKIPPNRLTPESQRHRANSLFQVAGIRAMQGRLPEAITNYYSAIQAYTQLTFSHPTNLQWQFELTRTWNDLGIAFARHNEFSNAAQALEKSLQARADLLVLQPTNVYWLASHGATAQNLGQVNRRMGRLDKAGEFLAVAEHAFRTWTQVEPNSPKPKERLALIRGSTGQFLEASGKLEQAAQAYNDKVQILRALLAADPQNARRQADFANGLGYVGALQARQSNFVAAVTTLSEAVMVDESLVARDPSNREWQLDLVTQLTELGNAYRQTNQPEEALGRFRRVWELSEAQADGARQYKEWVGNWRHALEEGEQLEEELSSLALQQGQQERANEHHQGAERLGAKRTAFPE